MSSQDFQLDSLKLSNDSDTSVMRVGIVVSSWNEQITQPLLQHVTQTLAESGIKDGNITVYEVPGSFELIYGCAQLSRKRMVDAIIALGCVIQGDTPHFDHICASTAHALADLNRESLIPVINGILTTNTLQQAEERSTGKLNKGREFAITAIKMIDFSWDLTK